MSMNFTPEEYEVYRLEFGDILLNEGQSPHLVGRPAMYRDEVPGACFTNSLVRFQAVAGIEPRFALVVFLAQLHMRRFMRIAQITTNIAHLGAGRRPTGAGREGGALWALGNVPRTARPWEAPFSPRKSGTPGGIRTHDLLLRRLEAPAAGRADSKGVEAILGESCTSDPTGERIRSDSRRFERARRPALNGHFRAQRPPSARLPRPCGPSPTGVPWRPTTRPRPSRARWVAAWPLPPAVAPVALGRTPPRPRSQRTRPLTWLPPSPKRPPVRPRSPPAGRRANRTPPISPPTRELVDQAGRQGHGRRHDGPSRVAQARHEAIGDVDPIARVSCEPIAAIVVPPEPRSSTAPRSYRSAQGRIVELRTHTRASTNTARSAQLPRESGVTRAMRGG